MLLLLGIYIHLPFISSSQAACQFGILSHWLSMLFTSRPGMHTVTKSTDWCNLKKNQRLQACKNLCGFERSESTFRIIILFLLCVFFRSFSNGSECWAHRSTNNMLNCFSSRMKEFTETTHHLSEWVHLLTKFCLKLHSMWVIFSKKTAPKAIWGYLQTPW